MPLSVLTMVFALVVAAVVFVVVRGRVGTARAVLSSAAAFVAVTAAGFAVMAAALSSMG